MKNLITSLFLVTALVSYASVAETHGGAQHVLGTVTTVADDRIVVKTVKGETVTIGLRASTVFTKKGEAAPSARPHVGDRLMAEVTKQGTHNGEDWVALAITFGTPKPHR